MGSRSVYRKAKPNSDVVEVQNKFPKILKLAANFSWNSLLWGELMQNALPAAAIRHYDAVKPMLSLMLAKRTKLRLGRLSIGFWVAIRLAKTSQFSFRKRMWLRKGLRLLSLVKMLAEDPEVITLNDLE
uniref:Uncharacterized protein n=1 Tax=Ditylenchus dipsaci TaxID=166011 RepID=A0A915DYI7_9BILA